MINSLKPFPCDNCGHVLCDRQGNEVVAGEFRLELRRKHYIQCPRCDQYTAFPVSRNGIGAKVIDIKREKTKLST